MRAGAYARRSQDQDRDEDAKSVTRQIDRAREFAKARGWQFVDDCVWVDEGVSGAERKDRHGFNTMLAAISAPKPPVDVVIVSEISRIGRDAARTPYAIQQIEDNDVQPWSYLSGRQITMASELGEIEALIGNLGASMERRKASQRSRDELARRAEAGFVAGGKCYGYRNVRPRDGARVERVVDQEQAKVINRIFTMAAEGAGYARIANTLNNEHVPARAPTAGPSAACARSSTGRTRASRPRTPRGSATRTATCSPRSSAGTATTCSRGSSPARSAAGHSSPPGAGA